MLERDYAVEVYDYETEDWRVVAQFDSVEEAIELTWSPDLTTACLAVDRCFTMGEARVINYRGDVLR